MTFILEERVLGCAPSPMPHLLNKERGFPRLRSHHSCNPIGLLIMRVNFYFLAFFFTCHWSQIGVSSHWFVWPIKTENQRWLLSYDDGCVVILTLKQAGLLVEWIMFTHSLLVGFQFNNSCICEGEMGEPRFQVSQRSGNTQCNPIVSKGLCALNPCVYI